MYNNAWTEPRMKFNLNKTWTEDNNNLSSDINLVKDTKDKYPDSTEQFKELLSLLIAYKMYH